MSTFQERFSKAFDAEVRRRLDEGEPRLTKTMVWKAAKATSGAFTQWYNGLTGAKLSTCFLIGPLLKVNPHWLFDESQEKHFNQTTEETTCVDSAPSLLGFTFKPANERDLWMRELNEMADKLDTMRLGMLIKTARDLVSEMPAKQTEKSSA